MPTDSRYSQLAIDGKWIALARLWLNENTPCSREKMFTELGMLMPGTVRLAGVLAERSHLVANAYRRIYRQRHIPEVVEAPKIKLGLNKGYTDMLRVILADNDLVRINDIANVKHGAAIIRRLASCGECERVSPGVYRKTSLLKLPTIRNKA